MNYRDKHIVSAIQWGGRNIEQVYDFCPQAATYAPSGHNALLITEKEGTRVACNETEWIVKDANGHFTVMSNDLFRDKYEQVHN